MKYTLFLLATIALVIGQPMPASDPALMDSILPSLGGHKVSDAIGITNVVPQLGSKDIIDKYTDGSKKINKYGSCVALQKNCKFIKSAVFSSWVKCDIYSDADCLSPKAAIAIILPGKTELHNPYNVGSYFAKAYKCQPLLEDPIPIDTQDSAQQLGITGHSLE